MGLDLTKCDRAWCGALVKRAPPCRGWGELVMGGSARGSRQRGFFFFLNNPAPPKISPLPLPPPLPIYEGHRGVKADHPRDQRLLPGGGDGARDGVRHPNRGRPREVRRRKPPLERRRRVGTDPAAEIGRAHV